MRALYDYTASGTSDLSIQTDEVLTELAGGDNDWMVVRNAKGTIGMVPRNYVGALADSEEYKATVLYDYDGDNDMYMSIREGMTLTVTEEKDGWCNGYTEDGRRGWFPASYVQKI